MDKKHYASGREMDFRDAVLDGAHSKAGRIIQRATADRERVLSEAYLQCEKANYEKIKAGHTRTTQREYSATVQSLRADLLRQRAALAQQVFGKARALLEDFAAGEKYVDWMRQKLEAQAAQLPEGQAATVYLRAADLPLEPKLAAALPGAGFEQAADIKLGGFKLKAGHLLFDETLDTALEAEQQAFAGTKALQL